MPRKKIPASALVSLPVMEVKFKDIFSLDEFYKALHEWFLEYGWVDQEDRADHWETYYSERVSQGNAKEMRMQWRAFKEAPDAPFLSYYLDLDFHIIGLSSVEVVKEGQKMSLNRGEIKVAIKPYLHKKYESEFERHWLLKKTKSIFTERLYRRTLEQRKKELFKEMHVLQNFMKRWFKLKRYLPYEEYKSFFPSSAWPSHQKEEK